MPVKLMGKTYNQVHERVHAVHNNEVKLECSITTEILSIEPDADGLKEVLIKSLVVFERNEQTFTFTGHAFGKQSTNPRDPEFAKFVEKTETTAVGRALAFAGLAGDDAIASAEEVQSALDAEEQAQEQRERQKPLDLLNKENLHNSVFALFRKNQESLESQGIDYWGSVRVIFGVESRSEMTTSQWQKLLAMTQDTQNWSKHFIVKLEPDAEEPDPKESNTEQQEPEQDAPVGAPEETPEETEEHPLF